MRPVLCGFLAIVVAPAVASEKPRRVLSPSLPLVIERAAWNDKDNRLEVSGTGPARAQLVISRSSDQSQLATTQVNSRGYWEVRVTNPIPVPCAVRATVPSRGEQAEKTVSGAPTTCDQTPPPLTGSHVGRFTTFEGTKTCLRCHLVQAQDFFASAHYQWRGDASEAEGLSTSLAGKLGGINDFCIFPDINWLGKLTTADGRTVDGGCARCHAGLGLKPTAEPTQTQLENIDCLICHAPSYRRTVALVDGQYRFVPDEAAMGMPILDAAVDIHRPTSATCLNCHARAGGGNNYKRGDIEEAHRNPTRDLDVHMAPREAGGAGLSCLDCHRSVGHRIAGRGVDLRERDLPDRVSCTSCHRAQPHSQATLNRHTARVACQTCHIPEFAKAVPTDMRRDWEQPGELDPVTGLWEPHMLKASRVRPEYRFFNGRSWFYEFGTPAQTQANGRVLMAGPLGSVQDRGAQIIPIKHHLGRQPQDPVTLRLLPLKIGTFFSTGNIDQAIHQGVAAVGWTDNGYRFVETERYMGIFHEVAPKSRALACATCHDQDLLDWQLLGYTPLATRNGKPLCQSCHGRKGENLTFYQLHDEHVREKRLDCSNCHGFSKAS